MLVKSGKGHDVERARLEMKESAELRTSGISLGGGGREGLSAQLARGSAETTMQSLYIEQQVDHTVRFQFLF
jgi:hypothetical protein